MMMMKSVFWWRKPEYPEETTDLRQVTDETFHTYGLCPCSPGIELGPQRVKQSELRCDERGALAHRATAVPCGSSQNYVFTRISKVQMNAKKKKMKWHQLINLNKQSFNVAPTVSNHYNLHADHVF